MNTSANAYFIDGCGRCPLGGTPDCKVNPWRKELLELRRIVLECGLKEEVKWGVPCYTLEKKNILIVSALKACATLSFFKGALLSDIAGILEKPGENSQATRLIKFTNLKAILKSENTLKTYVFEAIELEKSGAKILFKKNPEPIPKELLDKLNASAQLKTAFYALSPGRQRGYILYISAAKQSKTREARIEKYVPQILKGKGLNE